MGMIAYFSSADPATISRLKANPDDVIKFVFPEDEDADPGNQVDLDKAWHCIHFMLTGSAYDVTPPLGSALLGGESTGEDLGYGPARVIYPDQVRDIASALATIDEENFRSRYQPEEMAAADVYLADTCVTEGDEALDYLTHNYQALVEFYRDAAERGDGAVLWIS